MRVISIHTRRFWLRSDPIQGRQLARDVNDEIATMTRQWPRRFAGLATLPMQDVGAAVDELERAVHVLGLKGAELDTVMQGHNWDEPQFLPLFKAAEALGAVLFFHPQPQDNLLLRRTDKYGLANSIGVPAEDALVVATLIFVGFSTPAPRSRSALPTGWAGLLWHGPPRSGAGRCALRLAAISLSAPSTYQRRLYYDCITNSEEACASDRPGGRGPRRPRERLALRAMGPRQWLRYKDSRV